MLDTFIATVFPLLFVPQIEFAQPAPFEQRAKMYDVGFKATLVSGKSETVGAGLSRIHSALEACDHVAYQGAIMWWTFQQERTRLTLFDYQGDPIVGLKVAVVPREGDQGVLPQVTVRWVLRTRPPIFRAELKPAPRSGSALARTTAGAFTAAITTIAAPEIDFGTIPVADKWPRVYYIRVYTRLASGQFEEDYDGYDWVCDVPYRKDPDGRDRTRGMLRRNYLNAADNSLDVVADPVNLRVVLLDYRCREGDRAGKLDPVVGLMVETNGPVPALRWTFRPEVRKLLKK